MKETQKKDITTQPAQAAGENKMGILPIRPLLLSMAWPAILSMTISALYNIVDSIFVAKLSEDALTAVSIVNPIQMLIIALSVGSGVGINSLIARRLGAHRQEEADQAASTGLRIGVFNYLVFLLIGVCFTGIFDPILIFGLLGAPRLEVAGAAIATITGQLFGMLVGAFIIFKGEHLVSIQVRGFKFNWEIVADIYKVGLPSIVMQSIGSVMIIFYNMILVVYSTTAVAVLGVYFKIQSFVFMPVFGLNQGAMPIMGFNYGAAKKDRLMQTYKEALKIALLVMALGLLLFQALPKQLLLMFDASADMLAIGIPALRIISLCFLPAAFGIITGTLFQGTGHGVYSLLCSVIRQLIGILPLAFILIRIGGVTLSWASFPLAELLGLAYSALMLQRLYKNEISKLGVQ